MINLKQLSERYKDVGLGYIRFGGKSYYEINSDTPLNLNSYGGVEGFILNNKGEVELYDLNRKVLEKRHYFQDEDWDYEVDYETEHFWDEDESLKWWGKTLDNYYPHPWYPEREIMYFEIVNDIPFHRKSSAFKVVGTDNERWIEIDTLEGSYDLTVQDCLNQPEFFKPIYAI